MSNQDSQKSGKEVIRSLLSNPWFGGIAGTCSIFSVPLSIYLSFVCLSRPDLTALIPETRAVVYKSDHDAPLKVTFADKPVEGDVCIAHVAIWNRGNAPIRREDFLHPPEIEVSDGRVISADIRHVTRPESEVTAVIDPMDQLASNWIGGFWNETTAP